jgi:hypothetical protein
VHEHLLLISSLAPSGTDTVGGRCLKERSRQSYSRAVRTLGALGVGLILVACGNRASSLLPIEGTTTTGGATSGGSTGGGTSGTSGGMPCHLGDSGLFAPPIDVAFQVGPAYPADAGTFYSVALGDLNGDGNLDAVVAEYYTGAMGVLFGNGDGTFRPGGLSSVPALASYIAIFDLMHNASPSVVATQWDDLDAGNNLTVARLTSEGALNGSNTLPFLSEWSPGATVAADLNRDGIPDLLTPCDWGTQVFIGDRAGGFNAETVDLFTVGPNFVQDFNEDGIPDLVSSMAVSLYCHAPPSNTVEIHLGIGDGTFSDAGLVALTIGGNTGPDTFIGDVNEDGHADLIVEQTSCYDGFTSHVVLLGHGDGTFSPGPTPSLSSSAFSRYLVDINRDGHLDLVGDDRANIYLALGNGDGTFQTELVLPVPGAGGVGDIAIGDVNGDGWPDLVVSSSSSDLKVLLSNCH